MAHRELVVEVHRGLAEARHHLLVVRERSLDQLRAELLAVGAEVLQVAGHERAVNLHQRVLPGEVHREGHEQPLQTGVDGERARGGVHARHVLRVVDHLRRELLAVEPVAPAEMLPDLRDGHGGVVRVQLGHVQVIHEVDELILPRRAVVHTRLLLQLALQDLLERKHVREVVEVDVQAHDALGLRGELALDERRLPGARGPDEHDGRAQLQHHVQEVRERRRLRRRDEQRAHRGDLRVELHLRHQVRPRRKLARLGVDVVVKHGALARKLHRAPRALPPLIEILPVVDAVLGREAAAERPDHRQHEVRLERRLVRLGVQVLGPQHALEDVHQRRTEIHRLERRDVLERLLHLEDGLGDVLVHQLQDVLRRQLRVLPLGLHRVLRHDALDPGLDHVVPLELLRDVHDARARRRRRRRKLQVANLEDELHVRQQTDALVRGQREQPVVVHRGVHGLDPVRVQVAVEDDPLRVLVRDRRELAHVVRHHAVLPLASRHVDVPVKLLRANRLGVDIADHNLGLVARAQVVVHDLVLGEVHALLDRLGEDAVHLGAPAAGDAHEEDAVANREQLGELHDAQREVVLHRQAHLLRALLDHLLELHVALTRGVDADEQVAEQAHEDHHVRGEDLRDVEIAKRAEQHVRLVLALLGAQERAGHHKHRLDRAQTPVVVRLRGQHVLQQVVQRRELLREHLRLDEALRHEHVLHDELAVRNHHRDRAEQRFERLGELGAPDVPGVHGDEPGAPLLEGHLHAVRGDELVVGDRVVLHAVLVDEVQPAAGHVRLTLLRVRHALVLHRAHREHLGDEAVELVEAAPGPGRGEALEDVAHRPVIHLGRAVEDVHRLAQLRGQVLRGFRLARARRAGGRRAHREPARLRGGDVDAIGERRDHQAATVAEVLVAVRERGVADTDHAVVDVGVPVRAKLRHPLETRFVGFAVFDDADDHVARVRVDGDHVHDLLARGLVQVAARAGDEIRDLRDLLLAVLLHRAGVARRDRVERRLDFLAPVNLVHHQAELRGPVEAPLVPRLGVAVRLHGVEAVEFQLAAHLVDDQVHVLLHLARQGHLGLERDRLLADARHDALRLRPLPRAGLLRVQGELFDRLEALVHVGHHLHRVVAV